MTMLTAWLGGGTLGDFPLLGSHSFARQVIRSLARSPIHTLASVHPHSFLHAFPFFVSFHCFILEGNIM